MKSRWLLSLAGVLAACGGSHPAAPMFDGGGGGSPVDACVAPAATVAIADLLAHNTSASPSYDQAHFAANFGARTWVSQAGATMPVDAAAADESLNPVTPGHVSNVDVHTLIPSRPDLRWFAHIVPWFKTGAGGSGSHIDIGIESNSMAYVQAMLADMKRRGFDGLIVDWYGQGSYEDQATRLIQQALAADPSNHFTYIIMMDKGIPGLSSSTLASQIAYVRQQYWSDPDYELEGGKPILMFFGVDSALGEAAMAQVKAQAAPDSVWVTQGAGSLSRSYVDESFDWTHDYHDGPSAADPYDLAAVGAYYSAVGAQGKPAFGSMVAGFDGTLTKSVGWSEGKYLPRGDGACLVQWAAKIDAVIPPNVTRMQWATWSDWEEGTAVEPGVENGVTVAASVASGVLSWTVSGGTGDESTIDHYEVYASLDGVMAVDLGTVPVGTHSRSLADAGCWLGVGAKVAVIAVGKPMIRDHGSAWVAVGG